MTLLALVALGLAWAGVGGLALQAARGGRVLPAISVSDGTLAAARSALRRATWIALAISVAVAALWAAAPDAAPGSWPEVAVRLLGLAACPLVVVWGGAPLLRRGRNLAERAASAPGPGPRRTASLVVRDPETLIPRWLWAVPIALAAAGPATAVALRRADAPYAGKTVTTVVVACALSLTFLVAYGLWASLATTTPQDVSGARDPAALDAACRAFRRFLSRGIFALMTCCVVLGSAVCVAAVATDGDPARQDALCGLLGGIGGSLVGVGGGLLGAFADRHRRAILELGGVPPEPGAGRARRAAKGESS